MRHPEAAHPRDAVNWMMDAISKAKHNPFIYENHLRPQSDFLLPNANVFRMGDGFGNQFIRDIEQGANIELPIREVKRHMEAKSKLGSGPIDFTLAA